MGTRERRRRQFAEREQLFLDKAQELIRHDGLLTLQMSRIAHACDYAIGTLYQHFASKEDLLVALATRSCLSRVELFESAARWEGPTRERMLGVVLADLLILRDQPEYFRLAQFVWTDVVWGAASADSRQRALEASAPLSAVVDGIVVEARARGDLPANVTMAPAAMTIGPWAMCLGMYTLAQQEGLLDHHQVGNPYRLLLAHVQYLLNGYGWQPLFDPADAPALDALLERVCSGVFGATCDAAQPHSATSLLQDLLHGQA